MINKVRKNCTQIPLGSFPDSLVDAAVYSDNAFTRIKTPIEIFEIDDNYYYAGQVIFLIKIILIFRRHLKRFCDDSITMPCYFTMSC